jgi:hypothetical protein
MTTPLLLVFLLWTNFRRLWSYTHSSHNALEAHLLERRKRKLRKLLSAIEAGVEVRPESAWTNLTHLKLPKWDTFNTVSTLNINGSYSQEKQLMIKDFIYKNDVDIIFVQEEVTECLVKIPGYTTLYNIGTEKRGTAFITRDSRQTLKNYLTSVG